MYYALFYVVVSILFFGFILPHPVGGGVLIVEAMLFESRRGPITAQLYSLNMLVQTEGKEHPPSHYTGMLTQAGFKDVQVCRTGKSYDAVLAIK